MGVFGVVGRLGGLNQRGAFSILQFVPHSLDTVDNNRDATTTHPL